MAPAVGVAARPRPPPPLQAASRLGTLLIGPLINPLPAAPFLPLPLRRRTHGLSLAAAFFAKQTASLHNAAYISHSRCDLSFSLPFFPQLFAVPKLFPCLWSVHFSSATPLFGRSSQTSCYRHASCTLRTPYMCALNQGDVLRI